MMDKGLVFREQVRLLPERQVDVQVSSISMEFGMCEEQLPLWLKQFIASQLRMKFGAITVYAAENSESVV